MKNQLIPDTPLELSSTVAEAETVAAADCDCRPLMCVPPRQDRKNSSRFQPSSIPPDPSSLALPALPADVVPAFNVRAARMATVQPHRTSVGFRTNEKKQCSKPSLSVDLHRRSGTYMEQLDLVGWRQSGFRRPLLVMNAFASSETLGSTRSAM
jgi:hypothetical protein